MGATYLIDSNVVSDYLTARLPESGMTWLHPVIDAIPIISVITQIEILGFQSSYSAQYLAFTQSATILSLTPEVVHQTIELRKSRRIKLPDAIIAATALMHGLKLVTHNLSDFSGIPRLSLIDPYQV
jgi:predicted nucleic acid-binding protein